MTWASARMLTKSTMFMILCLMLVTLSVVQIGFGQATELKVVAPTTSVPVTTQFDVDATVVNVPAEPNALFSWQIKLYYNPAVLKWINSTLPSGHVFFGKQYFSPNPVNSSDAGGTYILMTASLSGTEPRFSGSGILCRTRFEAKTAGTSLLNFTKPLGGDTYLWNYDFIDIPATPVDGSVTVVGVDTRAPSSISVNVEKSLIVLGESLAVSGALNVSVADNTRVYIDTQYYESGVWFGSSTFNTSTTGSQYSYSWKIGEAGAWRARARWDGNDDYKSATSGFTETVNAVAPTTLVEITPATTLIGSKTVPLPTSSFTLSVNVENATDLYEWQVKLTFNSLIVEALEVLVPDTNFFGENYILLNSTIDNTAGFVQASARSTTTGVNGSGILFQVKLRGIDAPQESPEGGNMGQSDLNFDMSLSALRNSTSGIILFGFETPAATITVYGVRRLVTSIVLSVPSRVQLGSYVNITGQIGPLGAARLANVTISYRLQESTTWISEIRQTNNQSSFSYLWYANQTGTFRFKASWAGDALYTSSESPEMTMIVQEEAVTTEGPNIIPYIVVAVIVTVVVIIIVYLKKFRKPAPPPE